MFDDEKIRLIEKMPDGDTILIIWIKLLTLTGRVNAGGYILLTESIPYTDESLATIFDRPLMTVQLALKTFEKFNMLHLDNGTMVISNWDKHQNIEGLDRIRELTRLRVAKHREQLRLSNAHCNATETLGNATEIEKELDIKNKNKDNTLIYGELKNVFLSEGEYNKLIERLGKKEALNLIEKLSLGISSKGYKYKSHYATILTWARRDAPAPPPSPAEDVVNTTFSPEVVANLNRIFANGQLSEDNARYLGGIKLYCPGLLTSQNLYRVYQCLTGKDKAVAGVERIWRNALLKEGVKIE